MDAPAVMGVGFRRAMRRERVFRDRENPMDIYTEDQLYVRNRFGRRNILFILNLIDNAIAHVTSRSFSLPSILQLLICLRFLGCGSFLTVVGDTMPRVSKSTVCRCVRRVALALHRLMPELIVMPVGVRETRVKRGFAEIAGKYGGSVGPLHCRIVALSYCRIIAYSFYYS